MESIGYPIEVDRVRIERRKASSLYRLNVVLSSFFRFVGFYLLALAIGLHNVYILHNFSAPQFRQVLILFGSYPIIAWLAVYLLFRSRPWVATVFLFADVAMLTLAVYYSGGDRSLLFFVLLTRVVDQIQTSFRRAMVFAHLAVIAFALLLGWLALVEGRPIEWPAQIVKLVMLYGTGLYMALTARPAEATRRRVSAAVALARSSIAALEGKSEQLEASQRELQRVVHQNQLILQSAGEGIVGFDLASRIIFANERAANTIGYTVGDLVGRQGHDLAVHLRSDGTTCDGRECPLEAALVSGREETGENPGFYRKDGSPVPVEYTSAPMFEDGRLVGAVFSFRDIAERKQLRSELVAAKEAAEAGSRAKSVFLANMSHELRTPLNAIIGYSEMLQEEMTDRELTDLIPDLQKIQTAGRNLLTLLTDILEIAKIEAGRVEVQVSEFDLPSFVKDVMLEVGAAAAARGNELTSEVAADGFARGDVAKIRRIVVGLLSNACKFTEKGKIALSAGRDADALVFRITDNGIGMSSGDIEKAFGSFVQGDSTTTRKYGGSGLGLTISQRLCQMMNGTIDVKSTPGEGSIFTVRLPLPVAPAGMPAAEENR